ncbi:hypothetical protein EZS27_003376 [termite gut metagenome]|uniref:Pectate lyase n=1 Tax=termite gut metagenome TaxID=433724 RepID=A0A5J4SSM4_9ZZZZ
MKTLSLISLFTFYLLAVSVQAQEVSYKTMQPYKSWVNLVPTLDDAFYRTKEAVRIAENVLLYQITVGGWPKNIYMAAELTEQERQAVIAQKTNVNEATIDNTATVTEIEYLSKTYQATKDERYKDAVLHGIQYLLKAQYDNGGWPQFYPRPTGYYIHITYNDNAMLNVMTLLRQIYEKQDPYTFISGNICEQARISFNKGIDCILKTQVKQNGKLTVWCAQHDRKTLKPANARAYELPSLSGQESITITLMLMSLPNPSKEVIAAVDGAVEWFKDVKIEGITKEYFTNDEGKKDYRIVACTDCPPTWARFYELETNKPFFCDRDGIMKYSISEIGHERRNGYSWYNNSATKVLKEYDNWKKKINR